MDYNQDILYLHKR